MKNKRNLLVALFIALALLVYKLSKDIYKMGVKDAKIHLASSH